MVYGRIDSWINPSLQSLQISFTICQECKPDFARGTLVLEFARPLQITHVQSCLQCISISKLVLINQECLYWSRWFLGLYMGCSIYLIQVICRTFISLSPSAPIKWLWKSNCVPKIKFFTWLLLNDRLNTRNISRRQKNHLKEGYDFVLCQDGIEETVQHMFFECTSSITRWSTFFGQSKVVYFKCLCGRTSLFTTPILYGNLHDSNLVHP